MRPISKAQFNRFWEAALGTDWYVDEGPCAEPSDPDTTTYDIQDTWIAWQGSDSSLHSEFIHAEETNKRAPLRMLTIYRRWAKTQTPLAVLVATFEVPQEQREEWIGKIKEIGGVLSGV